MPKKSQSAKSTRKTSKGKSTKKKILKKGITKTAAVKKKAKKKGGPVAKKQRSRKKHVTGVARRLLSRAFGLPATAAYTGRLSVVDVLQHASLVTTDDSYLLMLDPQATGGYSESDVNAAYLKYTASPGAGNRLTCAGFVVRSGSVDVLHVVR